MGVIIRRFKTEEMLKNWLDDNMKRYSTFEEFNNWLIGYLKAGNILTVGVENIKYNYENCCALYIKKEE